MKYIKESRVTGYEVNSVADFLAPSEEARYRRLAIEIIQDLPIEELSKLFTFSRRENVWNTLNYEEDVVFKAQINIPD